MTKEEIEAALTKNGGFTKVQLAEWGVPWPPPKGWKKALISGRKGARMNNLAARTLVKEWFCINRLPNGFALDDNLSYEDFAEELRRFVGQVPPFAQRSDAVAFVRRFAAILLVRSRKAGTPPSPTEEEIRAFYDTWKWKRVRYDFIKNRQRRCGCCGATAADGIKIVVDHVKPIRKHWQLRLDPTNLQLLCDDCNMGKGSRDETNWSAA